MDEQKKPVGRPQIYQGWQPEQTGRRRPKPAQRPQEERRKGEYRPLAVTEQKVAESPKVLQMPIQRTEQRPPQPAEQEAEQRPPQSAEHPPVQKGEQQPSQPIAQKSVQGAEKQPQSSVQEAEKQLQSSLQETEQQQPTVRKTVRPIEQRVQHTSVQSTVRPIERRTSQVPVQKPMRPAEQRTPQPPVNQQVQQHVQRPLQPAEEKQVMAAKRRREQENEKKMRSLWVVFGFLCIALVAAIFYEIILGHGIKETGAERMEEQKQEFVAETEQNNIEILTPGGELVSEIRERENRRNLPVQSETPMTSDTGEQTEAAEDSLQ